MLAGRSLTMPSLNGVMHSGRPGIGLLPPGCHLQRVAAGTYLFREGASLDRVYVVRSGLIGLGQQVDGRRRLWTIAREGEVIGDATLLLRRPTPFHAFAITDASAITVPAPEFVGAFDRDPEFAKRWILRLSRGVRHLEARVADLLAGDLRSQIASVLVHELDGASSVHLTQQMIADLLGASRTSVNRVLQKLRYEGLVQMTYGQLTVCDRKRLEAILSGAGTPEIIASPLGQVTDPAKAGDGVRTRCGDGTRPVAQPVARPTLDSLAS